MSGYTNNDDEFVPLPEDLMQPLATEPELNLKVKGKRERMYRLLGLLCIVLVVVFFIVAISRGEGKKKDKVCAETKCGHIQIYRNLSSSQLCTLYMYMQRKTHTHTHTQRERERERRKKLMGEERELY